MEYGIEKIISDLGLLCPVPLLAKGGAATIQILVGIINKAKQNSEAQNAVDAMEITNDMAAFGIDAQLCTVDGRLQYHYIHFDEDVFLRNFAAYNSQSDYPLTIKDLCNNKDNIEKFSIFCQDASNPKDEVYNAIEEADCSIEELIIKNIEPEDRKIIELTIKDVLDSQMEGQ